MAAAIWRGPREWPISPDLAKLAKIRAIPIEAPYEVATATGEGIPITSKCRPRVQIGRFVRRVQFQVAPIEPGVCILGMSFLDLVEPLIRWKEQRMRLPVKRTEGKNYQWVPAMTLIPRALAGLTSTRYSEDKTLNASDSEPDEEEDVVQSTAAITDECSVTFEDLCSEQREDTNG